MPVTSAKVTLSQSMKNRLRRFPMLFSLCKDIFYLRHGMRIGMLRTMVKMSGRSERTLAQSIPEWDVPFPPESDSDRLKSWLTAEGVRFSEGKHSLYLPPQPALGRLLPEVVHAYPPTSGFKVLKDARHPADASHVARDTEVLTIRSRLIGRPPDQMISANYMHSLGIGPRIWDVCCWRTGDVRYSVFVVDHVSGELPAEERRARFIDHLDELCRTTLLRPMIPNWTRSNDFAHPELNRNLLQSPESGEVQYVDFENFRLASPALWTRYVVENSQQMFHFGQNRPWRNGKYLYQTIPGMSEAGKRSTTTRWSLMTQELGQCQIDLKGRVVLDVGCNAGMMLNSALAAGAAWGIGWDRPSVTRYSRDLLLSLGASRFHLTGADLNVNYKLENDIPPHLHEALSESIVFYLAVRRNVGLLASLQEVPWRALVYEGHQGESIHDVPDILAPLLTGGVRCAATRYVTDGDCGARPLAILVRGGEER